MPPDITTQIYDNLATAVLLFDPELRMISANTAAENLLHVSRRQIKHWRPKKVLPASCDFDDVLTKSLKRFEQFTERGVIVYRPYQKEITVDCCVTPVIIDHACTEIIVELQNVSALQHVMHAEELYTLHDAAKESVRAMAHEIGNPLGGVRGAAQLLQRELDRHTTTRSLTEYTDIIIQETDRLRHFVKRMLAGDARPDRVDINIHEIIEYVCNLIKTETEAYPTFQRDYDPSLPVISADRTQLIQVFLNIIRNALQATEGHGEIAIQTRIFRQFTIHKKSHRSVACVNIADDGPGIPPEIEHQVFYPMITARRGGTGLGLSIAQSLVRLHGGLIKYVRENTRTIFSIYLPVGEQ